MRHAEALEVPCRGAERGHFAGADGDLEAAAACVFGGMRRVGTKAGQRYDNHYCFVFRVVDGRLKEVVEYLDTALVDAALQPPPVPPGR